MVACVLRADLLADLAGAVDKTVSPATTLEKFRPDFDGFVGRHGCHGSTGEGTATGGAWQKRAIYRANLATCYAAGHRAQLIAGDYKS